ncbi:hypothetical protein ACHZG5_001518 [Yersinia enterocolitica]|uniref:Nucleoside phosphorylase domain-containing protein n=1 Tax=Yersinia intermedia TaxID=631 RepID=A0A208ZV92_YERIN|nr:nucleoside phosphorylase [Yersinia intermedia]EKN3392564.1 hypothetical protein [Yersinia enterocolitica]OVZ84359.1 hypothetical protein CBW57_17590 [Yersinia intermedia]
MNILIIEDNPKKLESIQTTILEELNESSIHPSITVASDLAQANRYVCTKLYDLVIFDMFLPENSFSSAERDCSIELITEFSASKNYQTEAIALTQFVISEIDDIQLFNLSGITVVHYNEDFGWKTALKQKINRAAQKIRCDFLIFCALRSERNAYIESDCELGSQKNIYGMNCQEIKIENSSGFIITPRGMGLVNMAIVSSKAIELFQPKIVAMSGICAGVEGESDYLDIIVGKTCWEYQTGKWKDGQFEQEPYHAELSRSLQVDLEQSSENPEVLNTLRKNLYNSSLKNMQIKIAPLSSGSAVIADSEMMKKIGIQQRKMAGLEMEMYALYESAAQSLSNPLVFGAKAVVDLGGVNKNNNYQSDGCIVSARYVILMLKDQLKKVVEA